MSKEEDLIAEFLKRNKPTIIPSELAETTCFERGFIKLVTGKCCSYCNTELNSSNIFIKAAPKIKKNVGELVLCKECGKLPDTDKLILNKVDYETFLKIKKLQVKFDNYLQDSQKVLDTMEAERVATASVNDWNYKWNHKSLTNKQFKKLTLDNLDSKIEESKKNHKANIEFLKNNIKKIIKDSTYVVKRYHLDYSKITFIKEREEEDYGE